VKLLPPVHPQRRWRNQPVDREVDRRGARWLWGALLGVALAALPAVVYLVLQNECLRLSYELSAARSELDRLVEAERRLRVQRASLESLAEVEAWALEENGMIAPAPGQVVVVRSTGSGADALLARDRGAPRPAR
jgi:hypothetical protein